MVDLIQNQRNDLQFLPKCFQTTGRVKGNQYDEDLAVKLFIKYCGKNMLAREKDSAYLSLPNNGVCSQKVKRNVTRCGEPLFRAYEMY